MAATASAGPQAGPSMSVSDIYANARALSGYLKEKADEIDRARQLGPEVVARVREAGMFRIAMPKSWGGPELSTVEQVEVIEELSKANAAVGWCVMIGCDSGFFSSYLDDSIAREVFPRLDMIAAGYLFGGKAVPIDGGYRISGQWPFGSGINHADVVFAGCVVSEDGAANAPSVSTWRMMLAPASACEILDTWHTTGLRGTGSNDFRISDLFVPREHSFSFFGPPKRDRPLYRSHRTFLPKVAGVPLGTARSVIDLVTEAMQTKPEFPSGRLYKNLPRIQSVIADAEMKLGAARSYVFSATEREWKKLEKGGQPSERERADSWLARVNAARTARDVIRMLFDAMGSSAIYANRSPLDRALRDAETWCQHAVVQNRSLEAVGAMLLKADAPPYPFL